MPTLILQKFSIRFLAFIVLCSGGLTVGFSAAQAQAKITFEEYQKQCLVKVQNSGIKGQLAQDICNCTIAVFKKKYSLGEFNQVVQKSKTDKAVAKQLATVGETCFEKYLYEE